MNPKPCQWQLQSAHPAAQAAFEEQAALVSRVPPGALSTSTRCTLRCLQVFLDTWLPFFLAEARHAAAFLLLYAPAPATEKAVPAPVQPPTPNVTSPQQPGSARAAAARAAAEAAAAKAAEVGCTPL